MYKYTFIKSPEAWERYSEKNISGNFVVETGGHTCTMKFENGVLTCSLVDNVKYTGPYAESAE